MDQIDRHERDMADLKQRHAEMNGLAMRVRELEGGIRKLVRDFDALTSVRKRAVNPCTLVDALRELIHG